MASESAVLKVATCQFSEDWNPLRNGRKMCAQIRQAALRGADVAHFHECALSGYGEAVGTPKYPWDELKQATRGVLEEAKRSKIWVVFGSSHPLTAPHKPHNSLYVVSPAGKIVDRYDKRFCTSGDLDCYSPGDHYATFAIKGFLCSCLICYDSRFPELYRDLMRQKVQVMFHSFHNARRKKSRGIWPKIILPTLQAHAATNHMWISAPNSAAVLSCWPGIFITPDGLISGRLTVDKPSVMVNVVDPSKKYYDAVTGMLGIIRRNGRNSGKRVNDPRSKNRTCY